MLFGSGLDGRSAPIKRRDPHKSCRMLSGSGLRSDSLHRERADPYKRCSTRSSSRRQPDRRQTRHARAARRCLSRRLDARLYFCRSGQHEHMNTLSVVGLENAMHHARVARCSVDLDAKSENVLGVFAHHARAARCSVDRDVILDVCYQERRGNGLAPHASACSPHTV